MRGAPWVGWITDLTKPDPYFILPVIYAVSMWVNMKLSPQPADPMQAKMMMWMPVIFSLLFYRMPAGLVLYFAISAVFGMFETWYIKKHCIKDAPLAGAAVPAKASK
ncbi:Membrane protein insertase YidC [compost metagenome]